MAGLIDMIDFDFGGPWRLIGDKRKKFPWIWYMYTYFFSGPSYRGIYILLEKGRD